MVLKRAPGCLPSDRMCLCDALLVLGWDIREWKLRRSGARGSGLRRYKLSKVNSGHQRTMEERVEFMVPGGLTYLYETAKARYKDRSKIAHPDHGGSHDEMAELNRAMDFISKHYAPNREDRW